MKSPLLSDLEIHPRILSALKKVKLIYSWRVLEISSGELKTRTKLSTSDIQWLIRAVSEQCAPKCFKGIELLNGSSSPQNCIEHNHIKTGSSTIDDILDGGLSGRGLTEISGESGVGKTQLAMQIAIQCQLSKNEGGLSKSVAYICTECHFSVKRLSQMINFRTGQKSYNGKPFLDNIYVHHLPDMDDLINCVRYELPRFISLKNVGLLIIDTVAAVFRASDQKQYKKSKAVQQLGFKLRNLSTEQNIAVLAINQVTSSFEGNKQGIVEDNLVPALGLSWSNLVTTRIMLRKTPFRALPSDSSDFGKSLRDQISNTSDKEFPMRKCEVIFCPWLPRRSTSFVVTAKGVEDVNDASIRFSCD